MNGKRLNLISVLLAGCFLSPLTWAQTMVDHSETLNRVVKESPESLDPMLAHSLNAFNILNDMFDGLMSLNQQGKPVFNQAVSKKVSADGKVWTFKLRQSQWSDNKTPVTANDFVYAWQRVMDPNNASPNAWYIKLMGIKNADQISDGKLKPDQLGIKALDPYTLEITLERPVPWLESMLTNPSTFPVPVNLVKKYGSRWTQKEVIQSNGLYHLTDRLPNSNINLSINSKNHWYSKQSVKKVVYHVFKNETGIAGFATGAVDITDSFSGKELNNYSKTLKDRIHTDLKSSKQLGTEYYAFNTSKYPFNQVELRQALAFAVDKNIIVNKITQQGEIPAYIFTPLYMDNAPQYKPEIEGESQCARINEARDLYSQFMKKSGKYSKKNPLEITLMYNNNNIRNEVAVAVSSMWSDTFNKDRFKSCPAPERFKSYEGLLKVNLQKVENKVLYANIKQGEFDIARASWVADFNEASSMLGIFTSDSSSNKPKFKDRNYDKLMAKALITLDPEQRKEIYQKMEVELANKMPIIPLYHYVAPRLVNVNRVSGYYISPQDQVLSRYLRLNKMN